MGLLVCLWGRLDCINYSREASPIPWLGSCTVEWRKGAEQHTHSPIPDSRYECEI